MFADSHAHYDDSRFDGDRDELLSQILPNAEVSHVINVGADIASSYASVALSREYDYFYASVGVHPHEADKMPENGIDELKKLALDNNDKVVAIGEAGLDYFYMSSAKNAQLRVFEQQLELSREIALPVIIHTRDAFTETVEILKTHTVSGVIHCFTSDAEAVSAFLELGFYIGIGGAVTFKKAEELRNAVSIIPLDRILIETDCPYMSPEPFRGKRNDSQNLSFIAEKIAEIKKIERKNVENITKENCLRLFFGKND